MRSPVSPRHLSTRLPSHPAQPHEGPFSLTPARVASPGPTHRAYAIYFPRAV